MMKEGTKARRHGGTKGRWCGRTKGLGCAGGEGRRGTVLIVTMWIVFVLAGMVLVFARSMRVEAVASANGVATLQAACIERGAEQYLLALLEDQKDTILTLGPEYFQAQPIGDGWFWVLRPTYNDDLTSAYGVIDEGAKVHLNMASSATLSALPGITDELVGCILDWRDSDSDISPNGAESEYYMALPRPYYCKNAPLETVEELLLVKGAWRELLYGQPIPTGAGVRPALGTDLALVRGMFPYLTVYSAEPNTDSQGRDRFNVNMGSMQQLVNLLTEAFGAQRAGLIAAQSRPTPPFRDIFDYARRTGLTDQEFAAISDRLTTTTQQTLRGRINVNTAPREVLLCLGLEEADVDALITRRVGANMDRTNLSWVREVLGEKAVGLGERITVRAYQFAAEVLAASGDGRAFRRVRLVIDTRNTPARIVYRRDITDQGWPLAPEVLRGLRTGAGPTDAAIPFGKGAM